MSNALDLGTCWGTPNGQDLSTPSYMASGNPCVAEAICRRWSTTRGRLIDDPDYGYNLSDLISDDLTQGQIAYAQQQAATEAQKDERVLAAIVTFVLSLGVLTVTALITTATGPFQLVLSVSAVTTQILLVTT